MEKQKKGLDLVSIRLKKDRTIKSGIKVSSPETAVEFIHEELADYDKEAVVVLNLNTKGSPINASITSLGTLNCSLTHPREIFKTSILSNAAAIILMHNHPSGDCTPSHEDIVMTERMYMCGQILGIDVIDHIILGQEKFFSFRENDLVFGKSVTTTDMNKLRKEYEEEPEM